MSEPVKPAVGADRWELGYHREQLSLEPWQSIPGGKLSFYVLDACTHEFDDGGIARSDASVDLIPEDRHAIAAFCLDGQPFGFRWEDVDLLRDWAMETQTSRRPEGDKNLHNLADRIEALLRPRKEGE